MSRVVQPEGARGSLKWIQRTVNDRPDVFDRALLPLLKGARSLSWVSPLRADDYAEYRDAAFLERLQLDHLSAALGQFWPRRGPQWDALGISDSGDILLVEAKAHIAEMCSPATQASGVSRRLIDTALFETALAFGAVPRAAWADVFYQLANRLAHLHFLRSRGVPAWLVLVHFVGDSDMNGPRTPAEWDAAYQVAFHVMDIKAGAPLMKYVLHVHPDVTSLS